MSRDHGTLSVKFVKLSYQAAEYEDEALTQELVEGEMKWEELS